MTIDPRELADETFGLITEENSHEWLFGGDAAEHNRLAVEACEAFLAVYGDVYEPSAVVDGRVRDVITGARNVALSKGISVEEAMRKFPTPYEAEYGRVAYLNKQVRYA